MEAPTSAVVTEHDLVIDHEDWATILDPVLCQDSAAVECLARLLFTIKRALEAGPVGVAQAGRALSAGIEAAYLYTDAHKAARRLYLLSLTGDLRPQDEPLRLINEVIRRATAEGGIKKEGSKERPIAAPSSGR